MRLLPKTVRMRLKCGKCGYAANYQLKQIFISPKNADSEHFEDSVSFGDYFRCKKCSSGWPWELTGQAHLALSVLLLGSLAGGEDERLTLAVPQLFDGTPVRSAAQAEEHLLGIIEREPENAFVWNRLGNIYSQAGLVRKASEAFARALEINPKDLESHFGLGHLSYEKGRCEEAAEHLHQVVTLAWKNQEVPEKKLRELVLETLRVLFDMADRTNGEIPLLSKNGLRDRFWTGSGDSEGIPGTVCMVRLPSLRRSAVQERTAHTAPQAGSGAAVGRGRRATATGPGRSSGSSAAASPGWRATSRNERGTAAT